MLTANLIFGFIIIGCLAGLLIYLMQRSYALIYSNRINAAYTKALDGLKEVKTVEEAQDILWTNAREIYYLRRKGKSVDISKIGLIMATVMVLFVVENNFGDKNL